MNKLEQIEQLINDSNNEYLIKKFEKYMKEVEDGEFELDYGNFDDVFNYGDEIGQGYILSLLKSILSQ